MGLFNKLKEPVFLKESSDAQQQLEKLKTLEPLLNTEGQVLLRQDINCLEYGIAGEKSIAFELKNSFMPMYILHDIYLETGELNAQIDYLVFTKKICFIIECKNLYGNIEIDNTGDFIRTMEFGGKKKREGIYSPITQNQRHLELMKKIKVDNKGNILTRFMADRYFEDLNKSIVVLANPKTILNTKFAKKEVKEKVIRGDQLVKYIKTMYEQSKESPNSEEKMLSWAQFYLDMHKRVEKDYTAKYDQYRIDNNSSNAENDKTESRERNENEKIAAAATSEESVSVEETEIFKELKAYRLLKSREENIKPYYIYNDNQMKDIINKRPGNIAELQEVNGFGEVKANKYGKDIIRIVEKSKTFYFPVNGNL